MRLKALLVFISIMAVGISNNCPSKALTPSDPTSEQYLINHGHSKEIVRMINLQKERTEGHSLQTSKSENIIKKIFKNLWFEQDVTMSINDFGYNDIQTVETDKSILQPAVDKTFDKVKDKINEMEQNKRSKDSDVIYINEIKVRDSE